LLAEVRSARAWVSSRAPAVAQALRAGGSAAANAGVVWDNFVSTLEGRAEALEALAAVVAGRSEAGGSQDRVEGIAQDLTNLWLTYEQASEMLTRLGVRMPGVSVLLGRSVPPVGESVGVPVEWRDERDGWFVSLDVSMRRLEEWADGEVYLAEGVDVADATALWEGFKSALGPMRVAIEGRRVEPQRWPLNAVLDQFDALLRLYDRVSGLVRRVSVDGNTAGLVEMPSWRVAVGLDEGQRAAGTGVSASGVFSGQASLPLS
jgi:hypothetical protein